MADKIIKPHGDNYYVTPVKGGWNVTCENSSPVAYAFEKKEIAIQTAKQLAKKNDAFVVIKGKNASMIAKEKKKVKADYRKKLVELEVENNELKKKRTDFKDDGQDKQKVFYF